MYRGGEGKTPVTTGCPLVRTVAEGKKRFGVELESKNDDY